MPCDVIFTYVMDKATAGYTQRIWVVREQHEFANGDKLTDDDLKRFATKLTVKISTVDALVTVNSLYESLDNITVGDYKLIDDIYAVTPTSPACENIMAEASSASTVAAEALEDAETATKNISTVAGEVASQAETLSTHTTQLSAIQSQLDEDASSLGELGNEINTLSAWQEKVAAIAADVPTGVDAEDGTALKVASKALLNADGSAGAFFPALKNLLGSLMLAAPNDDQTQVLGYLGDGTDDLTASSQVRSSAALTAAYESGGSGGTSGLRLVKNGINNVLYDGDDPVTNLTLTANQAGNLTSNYAYMAPEGFVAATEQEESQFLTTQYAAGGFVITNPATTEDIALTVLDTLPTAQITADDLTTMKRSGSFVFMDTAVS